MLRGRKARVFLVWKARFCERVLCCSRKRLHEIQLVWYSCVTKQEQNAFCALLIQTDPSTAQKWINVRFVCISLRTVPVICVLFYSTGLKFVRHKEGTKCILCTAPTNRPHYNIKMNQCPLRVHQLTYCPCNMRPILFNWFEIRASQRRNKMHLVHCSYKLTPLQHRNESMSASCASAYVLSL